MGGWPGSAVADQSALHRHGAGGGATYRNSQTQGRGLIHAILEGSGDIRLESEKIEVHFDQWSAPRYARAMQSLCAQMNALSSPLPETSHYLRSFVKDRSVGA